MDTLSIFSGPATSRIALGCGRLAGGAMSRASAKVIDTALDLGVTHFDVAPSYGAGLAERVLGRVVAGVPGVAIVTKAGIPRPGHGLARSLAVRLLRPVARRLPGLARNARAALSATGERSPITAAQVEASFQESLRELGRDRVDGLLLHEPGSSVASEIVDVLEGWRERGRIGAYGAGTGDDETALARVGTIAQFRWTPAHAAATERAPIRVRHGLLRFGLPWLVQTLPRAASERARLAEQLAFDLDDPDGLPSLLVTMALALDPGGVVLVSTNRPVRLRQLLAGIDWSAARGERPEFIRAATVLCDSISEADADG